MLAVNKQEISYFFNVRKILIFLIPHISLCQTAIHILWKRHNVAKPAVFKLTATMSSVTVLLLLSIFAYYSNVCLLHTVSCLNVWHKIVFIFHSNILHFKQYFSNASHLSLYVYQRRKKHYFYVLCTVMITTTTTKKESVYHVLRWMNPKNPKSLYSGCDILSFNQQTVHEVQRQWRTSSSRRSGILKFTVYSVLDWVAFILEGDQCLWHFLNVCVHILFLMLFCYEVLFFIIFVWQRSTPICERIHK